MTEPEGQLPVFLCPVFMLKKTEQNKTISITFLGQEVPDTPTPPPSIPGFCWVWTVLRVLGYARGEILGLRSRLVVTS